MNIEEIRTMKADPMRWGFLSEQGQEMLSFLLNTVDKLGKALGEIYQYSQSPDQPLDEMTADELFDFVDQLKAMAGSALFHYHYPEKAAQFDAILNGEKGD